MSLTLADLRTMTKQLVGNRTSTTMTSSWYDARINNGYRRLATFQGPVRAPGMRQPQMRRLGFFELQDAQTRSITIAQTTNFVTPSPATNVAMITDVFDLTNNKGLERRALRELKSRDPDGTGRPRAWAPYGRGGALGYLIDRHPATTSDEISVQESIYKYPALLVADGNTPVLPDEWHTPIAYAAAAEAALLQDIPEKATEMESRFMDYLAERKSPMEEAAYTGLAGGRRFTPIGYNV